MGNIKLAGRYAKSLIDLAKEKNQLEQIYNDALYFNAVAENRDFVVMMRSPVIPTDKKQNIFQSIFGKNISELTSSFFKIVIAKGRESFLKEIMNEVVNQYNDFKGITKVQFTSAVAVDAATVSKIKSIIEQSSALKNVSMETKVNENLIGGFVLEFNNNIFDSSVLKDLKDIRKQFTSNDFVSKI
jgi:F-type H+-transporting ATPase subunit delta